MPDRAKNTKTGRSRISTDVLSFDSRFPLITKVKMKSPPASKKRYVAIETGVRPSANAILTTTKELPQKTMRATNSNALVTLRARVAIAHKTFKRAYKPLQPNALTSSLLRQRYPAILV